MIVLLYIESSKPIAESIGSDLYHAFKGNVEINLTAASSPSVWPKDVNWDDLLIVLFDETPFPAIGDKYISEYLNNRNNNAPILPVALVAKHKTPPKAAMSIKALEYNADAQGADGRLVRRAGSMLGLRVQQRDHQIFISYRAVDGTEIAKQLEQYLVSLNYPVWRDEARELDGETKILPGSEVQAAIDTGLERASMVLLIDTPASPNSNWIKHEIDTANGLLLPILPLCFRIKTDPKKGPRFPSLLQLQRWVPLLLVEPSPTQPLTEVDLSLIVYEMERYICEIFRRKCRVPYLVEKEFVSRNYSWRLLDQRLLMSESVKIHSERLSTNVLSHCSIFDQVHGPAINRFAEFLEKTGRPNHSLFIYDGELIPELLLEEIIKARPTDDGVVILHHQELAALIDSNFTTL